MMRMRLEVRRFGGSVLASQEADYINTHQQFVLVVAASIPSEGGAGSGPPLPEPSANLLMDSFWIQPPSVGESVYATEVTITAQPVDEIVSA